MDALAISLGNGFHNRFTHGWVRVHTLDDLVAGGFQVAGYYCFNDHIRNAFANHMATQPFAVFLVENNLHKSIFMSAGTGFSTCAEGEFAHQYLIAFFFCLGLGKSYRSHLWMGVSTTRYVTIIQRIGM